MGAGAREMHAKLLQRLTAAGARAVVFDIVFSQAGPSADADNAFAKEIRDNAPPMKDRMADASARMAQANQMMAGMAQSATQATTAIATGADATATITAARQTGAMMNFNPVVELDLLVIVPSAFTPVSKSYTMPSLRRSGATNSSRRLKTRRTGRLAARAKAATCAS